MIRHLVGLTLTPPWSWSVSQGYKLLENRDWPTKRRGWFAVHAGQIGKSRDRRADFKYAVLEMTRMMRVAGYRDVQIPTEYAEGAILAVARITDCVSSRPADPKLSPWWIGDYAFVLADILPLKEPVICSGALGFWRVPDAQRVRVAEQIPDRIIESETGPGDLLVPDPRQNELFGKVGKS